jgi:hypothetical protein
MFLQGRDFALIAAYSQRLETDLGGGAPMPIDYVEAHPGES